MLLKSTLIHMWILVYTYDRNYGLTLEKGDKYGKIIL